MDVFLYYNINYRLKMWLLKRLFVIRNYIRTFGVFSGYVVEQNVQDIFTTDIILLMIWKTHYKIPWGKRWWLVFWVLMSWRQIWIRLLCMLTVCLLHQQHVHYRMNDVSSHSRSHAGHAWFFKQYAFKPVTF